MSNHTIPHRLLFKKKDNRLLSRLVTGSKYMRKTLLFVVLFSLAAVGSSFGAGVTVRTIDHNLVRDWWRKYVGKKDIPNNEKITEVKGKIRTGMNKERENILNKRSKFLRGRQKWEMSGKDWEKKEELDQELKEVDADIGILFNSNSVSYSIPIGGSGSSDRPCCWRWPEGCTSGYYGKSDDDNWTWNKFVDKTSK
jgi:hypothetical protein